MMAGSATAMGSSDVVLTSTRNKMSKIFEKHKKHGHLNTLNLSIEDRNTVRQVAESLPSKLIFLSTTAINLIAETGSSDTVSGYEEDFFQVHWNS